MGAVLTILRVVLSLLPTLIEAIRGVEEAIPGKGKGEQKLSMVREAMEEAYKEAPDATVAFGTLWNISERLVEKNVERFNADPDDALFPGADK